MKGTRSRIVDLVRQAKCELGSGNRSKALGLLKRALIMDPGGNTITETILTIEKELIGNTPREAGKKTAQTLTKTSKTAAPKQRTVERKPVAKPPAAEKKTAPEPTPSPKIPGPKPRTVERRPVAKPPAAEKKTAPEPAPSPKIPGPKPRTVERRPVAKPPAAVEKPAGKPGSVSNITRGRRTTPAALSSRKDEESSQNLIRDIFAISDSALKAGDETGALECLKRAEVLSPDNPEVKKKMTALRRTLKARVMVKTGCNQVAKGRLADAVKSARKAFDLVPGLNGLRELISDIEDFASREFPGKKATSDYEDAEVWVSRIRSRIQEGAFPLAAELAAEACAIYPDHKLIRTFVDRFTKMKLLPG